VQQFEARDGNVIDTKLRMTEPQSGQVTRIMDDIKCSERDSRFEWCWVEISMHNHAGEITDFVPKGPSNIVATATIMHLIAKRSLKPQYKALDVYNLLMKNAPPAPGLRPGGAPVMGPGPSGPPPGGPVVRLGPPNPPPIRSRRRSRSVSSTDSDSTSYSSDSSVGAVRRRLRRYRARKTRVSRRRCYGSDSDSDSDVDDDEEAIKVRVELKRGDDIVKRLLELWTVEPEVTGKGKGKMV